MDNSLIPRAFSPTDAKREREANAREAERRSSARNTSNASIPDGGALGLSGDINVTPGGNINLAGGGGINVAAGGTIKLAGTAPGVNLVPYDTTTVLGTQSYVHTDGGTYVAPGVYLTNPVDASKTNLEFRGWETALGYQSGDATARSRLSVSSTAARIEGQKSPSGGGAYGSFVESRQSGVKADATSPDVWAVNPNSVIRFRLGDISGSDMPAGSAGALLGWTDTAAYARYRANNAGGHWVESSNAAATVKTSVGTTGDGKLTIQATNGVDIVGALTNNGSPISGGSVPTDNITLTGTLQASIVKGGSGTITNNLQTGTLVVDGGASIYGAISGNNAIFSGNVSAPTINSTIIGDSGWLTATYTTATPQWADYGGGFGGLQYRKVNNVLWLRGTIKGGALASDITTLPAGYRPIVPAGATAMEFAVMTTQSSVWYPTTCYAYNDGRIRYAGNVGSWSGTDRLVINIGFPL